MLKSSFESNTNPRCFWGHLVILMLLNLTGKYKELFEFDLREKKLHFLGYCNKG